MTTDVNNDGVIDSLDIGLVRIGFRTASPMLDVNQDGKVDAVDIGFVRRDAFTEPVGTIRWDVQEEACFAAINEYRQHPERWLPTLDPQPARAPLQPLRRSWLLSQAADWMADWCCEQLDDDPSFLSHNDDVYPDMGARIVHFFPAARYGYMGEVALGTDGGGYPASGYHSFVTWTESPGHNGILLGRDYVSIGIGHAIHAASGQHRWYADFTTKLDTTIWPS